ncbi:MAG: helix-turn-helix domain-containing protein [Candidatus Marinimicrobia bacterium]|nr:helix-turn-helix domain-containing protein [Candidatus Neomarinimicrobiota bacterium]
MSLKRGKERYCGHCGSPLEHHLSIESAAQLYDCSEQFFRNLVRDRKIGFVKIGRLIRIPYTEIIKISNTIPLLSDELRSSTRI